MKKLIFNSISITVIIFFIFNLITLIITPKFIPYSGFFPTLIEINDFKLPSFLNKTANFDGMHYLSIAKSGYHQYEQAFFPLYPILIKSFSFIINDNYLLAGIFIPNLCFIAALYFLFKYLKLIKLNIKSINWFFLFLLAFPTSFYFNMVYTESIFLFLFISCIYFLERKKFLLSAFIAILASLTRINGVFLIIYFLLYFYYYKQQKKINYLYIFTPLLGISLYSLYLTFSVHDPIAFVHSITNYGRQTTPTIFLQVFYRYFKIFIIAAHDFKYYIAIFEFIIFSFFAFILSLQTYQFLRLKTYLKNLPLFSLNIVSWIVLIFPSLTGTFSSLPRYSLMSISVFIYLAQIKNTLIKTIILSIFIIAHFFALAFFSQGYFIS